MTLFSFPFQSLIFFPYSVFILSLTQTCVATVLEVEGIWKEEPFKTPSGNLGTILYAHHLRWSNHKERVLEKDVLIEYHKKVSSQLYSTWKEKVVWTCILAVFLLNLFGYRNVTWAAEGVHRLRCQPLYCVWEGDVPVFRCCHSRSITTLQSPPGLAHCSWLA